jgi:hypothetical protein
MSKAGGKRVPSAKSITRLAETQALRSGGPYLLRPLNGFENAPAGAGLSVMTPNCSGALWQVAVGAWIPWPLRYPTLRYRRFGGRGDFSSPVPPRHQLDAHALRVGQRGHRSAAFNDVCAGRSLLPGSRSRPASSRVAPAHNTGYRQVRASARRFAVEIGRRRCLGSPTLWRLK